MWNIKQSLPCQSAFSHNTMWINFNQFLFWLKIVVFPFKCRRYILSMYTKKRDREVLATSGHLWHRYSITVNQVVVATVKHSKWWPMSTNPIRDHNLRNDENYGTPKSKLIMSTTFFISSTVWSWKNNRFKYFK
jgi:hypothetical protein